jgi:hypothetical protein
LNPKLDRKYHTVVAEKTIEKGNKIEDNLNDYFRSEWIHYGDNIYLKISDLRFYKGLDRKKIVFREKDFQVARILGNIGAKWSSHEVFMHKYYNDKTWKIIYYIKYRSSLTGGIKMSDIETFQKCGFSVFQIVEDAIEITYDSDEKSDEVKIKLEELQANNIENIHHTIINMGGDI